MRMYYIFAKYWRYHPQEDALEETEGSVVWDYDSLGSPSDAQLKQLYLEAYGDKMSHFDHWEDFKVEGKWYE